MDGAVGPLGGRAIALFEPSRERLERLGAWYATEYEPLLRFAYFVCGDRSVAQDLVQEAFVRMYRAGAEVEGEGLPAYARRTVVNLHRSAFRRIVVERRSAARHDRPRHAPDPAEAPVCDEVWSAIRELSPRQRACVALRFYEDMRQEDIARTLGMSVGAVKKHTDRALGRLRALLGDGRER